jgi:hypothetical protein
VGPRLSTSPVLFFLALSGCAKKSNETSVEAPVCEASTSAPTVDTISSLTRILVSPTTAASCVTTYTTPHQAFPPAITAKNILVVFIPGTDGSPSDASLILQRGASRGYHTVGLSYPNPDSVNTTCNISAPSSLACHGEVREEILTGSNTSSLISVDTNNSIEGRLLALLKYLNTEGWGQYLSGEQILWNKIYLTGHSQGSGHAAFQAKRKLLGRIVLLSGTSDYSATFATVPPWMSLSSATPAASYYGFIHLADPLANYSGNMTQVSDAWLSPMGITGSLTSVDSGPGSPAYGNSHRLSTNACAAGSDLTKDACTLANGYQSVCDYLLFP